MFGNLSEKEGRPVAFIVPCPKLMKGFSSHNFIAYSVFLSADSMSMVSCHLENLFIIFGDGSGGST